jgi:hypothetical protein
MYGGRWYLDGGRMPLRDVEAAGGLFLSGYLGVDFGPGPGGLPVARRDHHFHDSCPVG